MISTFKMDWLDLGHCTYPSLVVPCPESLGISMLSPICRRNFLWMAFLLAAMLFFSAGPEERCLLISVITITMEWFLKIGHRSARKNNYQICNQFSKTIPSTSHQSALCTSQTHRLLQLAQKANLY